MTKRGNERKQAAPARANRRVVTLTWLGWGMVAILGGAIFGPDPQLLSAQTVAAPVVRGEKLTSPMASAVTNSPPPPNQVLAPTNVAEAKLPGNDSSRGALVPAPEVARTVSRPVTIGGDNYTMLTFNQLAGYILRLPRELLAPDVDPEFIATTVLANIPPAVKQYNEQAVALTGYMLPTKMNEGKVTEFMLLPNTMACCFGKMPRINEIVQVRTTGKGFQHWNDTPIVVAGTFHVGAITNGTRVVGIYRLDCEQIIEADSLKP
jgi:hypothetical protein